MVQWFALGVALASLAVTLWVLRQQILEHRIARFEVRWEVTQRRRHRSRRGRDGYEEHWEAIEDVQLLVVVNHGPAVATEITVELFDRHVQPVRDVLVADTDPVKLQELSPAQSFGIRAELSLGQDISYAEVRWLDGRRDWQHAVLPLGTRYL